MPYPFTISITCSSSPLKGLVLSQVVQPDAHVFLQLGLLSLREHQLTEAEQNFGQALRLDPSFFAAGYNLLLTRLTLGHVGQVGKSPPSVDYTILLTSI